MSLNLKTLFLFLLFIQPVISLTAQEDKQVISWDDHWLEVDESTGALVPFNQGLADRQSASLLLYADRFKSVGLKLCIEKGSSIFVDQQIIFHQETKGCKVIDCDSLFVAFASDTLLLTVYHPDFRIENYQASLLSNYKLAEDKDTLHIMQRLQSPRSLFLLTVLVALLTIFAIIRTVNHRGLQDFFNFRLAFALNSKLESRNLLRVFDQFNIMLMVFYAACLSLLLMVLGFNLPDWQEHLSFLQQAGYWWLMIYWLLIASGVSFVLFLKYFLLRMIASWFQLSSFADLHFIDYIRLSMAFTSFTLAICLYGDLSGGLSQMTYTVLVIMLSVFLLIRTIILFFKLLTFSSFRKLHLFSYLCTTEIIPLSIIIKVLFHGL